MANAFTPIISIFLLLSLVHPVFMSQMLQTWKAAYQKTMLQAINCTESQMQFMNCFDAYPSMNPASTHHVKLQDHPIVACCEVDALRICLKQVLIEDGSSDVQAEELSKLLAEMWSSNDPTECKFTRSSNPCLIHYNRTMLYVGIAILASLVLGTPLTYLLVKYGLRWYCCGHGPNIAELRSHLGRTLLNHEGGSAPIISTS